MSSPNQQQEETGIGFDKTKLKIDPDYILDHRHMVFVLSCLVSLIPLLTTQGRLADMKTFNLDSQQNDRIKGCFYTHDKYTGSIGIKNMSVEYMKEDGTMHEEKVVHDLDLIPFNQIVHCVIRDVDEIPLKKQLFTDK
jgi:hypothetical protein